MAGHPNRPMSGTTLRLEIRITEAELELIEKAAAGKTSTSGAKHLYAPHGVVINNGRKVGESNSSDLRQLPSSGL